MSAEMTLPDWVAPLLARFGQNPHGEPMYRIVWSEDQTELLYGETKRKYGNGRDRWILEKWIAPPESWGPEYEEALGSFPRQGTYEHCFTFELVVNPGEEPSFMPLRENVVEILIQAIEAGKLRHTDAERKAAIKQREEDIARERKRRFDDLWHDAYPAPGAKIPDRIKMRNSFASKTTADLPSALPSRGFKQLGES